MKIINKEYYRSKPMVNMTDDMVRITLTAKRWELRGLEMFIEQRPNTQMQTSQAPCDKCGIYEDKSVIANYCYNCGRALDR